MGCEMGKISAVMNKPVYLGQAILDLCKIITYKSHYDFMLPKYGNNLWLCYMDSDSFVYEIKTEDFYEDTPDGVEARFNASYYSCSCPLSIRVNKKVIGLMKYKLGRRIMTEFVALRPKLYTYKTISGSGGQDVQGSQ